MLVNFTSSIECSSIEYSVLYLEYQVLEYSTSVLSTRSEYDELDVQTVDKFIGADEGLGSWHGAAS